VVTPPSPPENVIVEEAGAEATSPTDDAVVVEVTQETTCAPQVEDLEPMASEVFGDATTPPPAQQQVGGDDDFDCHHGWYIGESLAH